MTKTDNRRLWLKRHSCREARKQKTSHPSEPTWWTAGAGWLAPWNCWKAGCCKTTCRGASRWITSSITSRRQFSAADWMQERDSLRVSEAKEASLSSERAEVPACAAMCCTCIWIDQCPVQKFKPRRYEVRIVVKRKCPNSCILFASGCKQLVWGPCSCDMFPVHAGIATVQGYSGATEGEEQRADFMGIQSRRGASLASGCDLKSCDYDSGLTSWSIAEWWMKWHFQILSWRGSFNQPNGLCGTFLEDEFRRFVWLNGRSCRGAKMWSSNWSLTHLNSQQWCSVNSRTQTGLILKMYLNIEYIPHATYD